VASAARAPPPQGGCRYCDTGPDAGCADVCRAPCCRTLLWATPCKCHGVRWPPAEPGKAAGDEGGGGGGAVV
jgi:hypothetical protein